MIHEPHPPFEPSRGGLVRRLVALTATRVAIGLLAVAAMVALIVFLTSRPPRGHDSMAQVQIALAPQPRERPETSAPVEDEAAAVAARPSTVARDRGAKRGQVIFEAPSLASPAIESPSPGAVAGGGGVDAVGSRRAEEERRRRSEASRLRSEASRRSSTDIVLPTGSFVAAPQAPSGAIPDSTPAAAGSTAPSVELALAGYDEVWIIGRDRRPRSGEATRGGAHAEDAEPAGLRARRPSGEEMPFPLKETDVSARVDGRLASVDVRQRYGNPYDETIEAVYVFPLPDDSAVSDFVMTVGERRIRGVVREREEAERVYREARAAGHVASLLTQERPNIFTERVANIDPGHQIDIELRYFGELPPRDGWYELVFPTVVGPRFNPPGSSAGIGAVPVGAAGASGQSTEVQYLAPGERTDHRFRLAVDLDAGLGIEELESPTHAVDVEYRGVGQRRVTLADGSGEPGEHDPADRDFVLRWRVAGDDLKTALLRHEEDGAGWLSLLLEPPAELRDLPRQPMEWVFVLDYSGSMAGEPLAIAKRAVIRVLEDLEPHDSFQVIRFSSSASQLGAAPLPATKANIAAGISHVRTLRGGGGTMMIEGIKAALDFPHDPERYRMVVFLTDGFIGNEAQILSEVHRRLGDARIFSFAVGSAPNRYLLDRMARLGRGAVAWVGPNAEVSEAEVASFLERVTRPALTDVTVDWGGAAVEDVFPTRVPDVFLGRPVALTARYSGKLPPVVRVRGRAGGLPVEIAVPTGAGAAIERPALPKLWARAKIRQLVREGLELGQPLARRQAVTTVALRHGLASDYTAFLAVDSLTRTSSPHGTTIVQPVPVPAGVRYDTTVGATRQGG